MFGWGSFLGVVATTLISKYKLTCNCTIKYAQSFDSMNDEIMCQYLLKFENRKKTV